MQFSMQDVIAPAVTIRTSALQSAFSLNFFWKEPLGGDIFDFSRRVLCNASSHRILDQASFKCLEGAKSDLQHGKKKDLTAHR